MTYAEWRRRYRANHARLLAASEKEFADLLTRLRRTIPVVTVKENFTPGVERQISASMDTYVRNYERTLKEEIARAGDFEAQGSALRDAKYITAAVAVGFAASVVANLVAADPLGARVAEAALKRTLPSGVKLSARVWDLKYEKDIFAIIRGGIANNLNAEMISKQLNGFILPGRHVETLTPYGRALNFDSMRLARTEVMRAYREAARETFRTTPWVTALIWRLGSDNPCPECTANEGDRYTSEDVLPDQDLHPHCSCYWEQDVLGSQEWSDAFNDFAETGKDELGIAEWLEAA